MISIYYNINEHFGCLLFVPVTNAAISIIVLSYMSSIDSAYISIGCISVSGMA